MSALLTSPDSNSAVTGSCCCSLEFGLCSSPRRESTGEKHGLLISFSARTSVCDRRAYDQSRMSRVAFSLTHPSISQPFPPAFAAKKAADTTQTGWICILIFNRLHYKVISAANSQIETAFPHNCHVWKIAQSSSILIFINLLNLYWSCSLYDLGHKIYWSLNYSYKSISVVLTLHDKI